MSGRMLDARMCMLIVILMSDVLNVKCKIHANGYCSMLNVTCYMYHVMCHLPLFPAVTELHIPEIGNIGT